jgi:hypothetical protein
MASRQPGGVGVDINRIRNPHFGQRDENLPISNNCQQTHSAAVGRGVDTFGPGVLSSASFPRSSRVAENTKFLDNDFITASR